MNSLILRRRAIMGSYKESGLPAEYQEVEYLESSETQYIDTGVIPTLDSSFKFVAEIYYPSIIPNTERYLIGARNPQRFQPIGYFQTKNIGGYGSNWAYFSGTLIAGIWYNYDILIQNGLQNFNGTITNFNTVGNFSSLYMFAQNGSSTLPEGTPAFLIAARIKKMIIQKDNLTVRNFIPCYRKADNKPGMYDLVTSTFFVNAGTGDFTVGPDVN